MDTVKDIITNIVIQDGTEGAKEKLEDLFFAFLKVNDSQSPQCDTAEIYLFKKQLQLLLDVARKEFELERYDK
jgi:hypothetical protein